MASSRDNTRNIAVSDFMTKKVKTIMENETMRQACKLMYQDNIGSIVILKKDTDNQDGTTTKKEIAMGMVTEK